MKATGVVHLGNLKILTAIRENLAIVIFTLLFAFGVLLGVLFFADNKMLAESEAILDLFNDIRKNYAFSKSFFTLFIFEFAFLFAIFLFGTSLLGLAFVPFIIFVRGAFSGLLLCGLYSNLGLTGITLNLLTLLPSTIINVLTLISGAGCGLDLSYSLCKLLLNGGLHNKVNIKFVLKKFGLYVFIITVGTLFEAFSLFAFKKFFV